MLYTIKLFVSQAHIWKGNFTFSCFFCDPVVRRLLIVYFYYYNWWFSSKWLIIDIIWTIAVYKLLVFKYFFSENSFFFSWGRIIQILSICEIVDKMQTIWSYIARIEWVFFFSIERNDKQREITPAVRQLLRISLRTILERFFGGKIV